MEINFVLIATILIWLLYIVIGGIKGFFKSSLSLLALILAGTIVMAINPFVTGFLRDKTGLDEWIEKKIGTMMTGDAGEEKEPTLEQDVTLPMDVTLPDGTYLPAGTTIPAGTPLPEELDLGQIKEEIDENLSVAQQSKLIESLPIPDSLKHSLEENNNTAVYQVLGVETFTDYIGSFVSNICLNIIGYVITFLIVLFSLQILMLVFNLVDRLPIIHGINHFAGALLGILKGFLVLEILFLVMVPFADTGFGQTVLAQIGNNGFLSALYHKNILIQMLMKIVMGGL